MKKLIPLLLLVLISGYAAFAQTVAEKVTVMRTLVPAAVTDKTLSVQDAFAFATTPVQKAGAIFLTIINNGAIPDRLLKADTDIADMVELHKNVIEQNTVMMIRQENCDIPAGQTTMFEPTGNHIMLMGLHAPLKAGDVFPLKLTFEKKGEVDVEVTVRNPADIVAKSLEDEKSKLP